VALGPAVGPAVGGLLLEVASWRWLLWINMPIGIATLLAARVLVPAGLRNAGRLLDRTGLAPLGLGLPLLVYGATDIGATGPTAITVFAVVAGAALATGFVVGALRASALLVLRLLRRQTFAAATASAGLTGANMYHGLLLLPLYFQLAAGRDTAETGLLLLAMGLGSAVALPAAGTLTDRHGDGPVTLAGAGLPVVTTVPCLLPGAFLSPGTLSAAALVLVLVARGTGMALAQMPAMTAAHASVAADEMGDAATPVNIVQRLGGAIGAVGVVVTLARTGGGASTYGRAFALLAAVSILTLVSAAILRCRTRTRPWT
jgi:MFS family permease